MDLPQSKKQTIYLILGGALGLLVLAFAVLGFKAQWTIHQITALATQQDEYQLFDAFGGNMKTFKHLALPQPEENRQNFLIVGMRGFGKQDGPLLTDTIMLISIERLTNKTALISIPRDLFVQIPYGEKTKVNELYSLGYEKGGEKLAFNLLKTVVAHVAGVYVDGMMRIDFDGFQKLIDNVGGIDVYLENPFQEVKQWEGAGGFFLSAGLNRLSGEEALYFARSRFSTSDFDRARRQQIILIALKKKLGGLGVLSNPLKMYAILDILGNHIKTDIAMNVGEGLSFISKLNDSDMRKIVLSTQNFLVEGVGPHNAYILLPRQEDFSDIHRVVKNIFFLKPEALSAYTTYPQTPAVHSTSTKVIKP